MEDPDPEDQQESLSGADSETVLGPLDIFGAQQLHLPCEYRTGGACVVAKELKDLLDSLCARPITSSDAALAISEDHWRLADLMATLMALRIRSSSILLNGPFF